MMWTICFDTICTGWEPICETDEHNDRKPVEYATEAEAQAEIDSDPEFYGDCFPCLMAEIGRKAIWYPTGAGVQ